MIHTSITSIFKTLTLVLLEFLRIILLFLILGGIAWELVENLYTLNETTETYQGIGGIGILVFLFVLYRNKLQFSGWYKHEENTQLSKPVTNLLIVCGVLLLAVPFGISLVLN